MRLLNLPGSPALLPGVGGQTDPAAALRAICHQAIAETLDDTVRRVVMLAAGDADTDWPIDQPYRLGRLVGGSSAGPSLPLPLAVGRELLGNRLSDSPGAELILRTVSEHDDGDIGAGQADLIIAIADGSALAHPGGPAAVHPRADEFDRGLEQAWRSGAPSSLAAIDTGMAADVMATGGPVWRRLAVIAATAAPSYRSKINFADAPFGVFTLVTSWR